MRSMESFQSIASLPPLARVDPSAGFSRRKEWRLPALTYKDAGVDIDAGSELVRRIAAKAPGIGGFGGLYSVGEDSYEVVGTDGVGTKLKLAFEMNAHDTIGIDLVAMNVNDIVTTGARPMYFLDQFSTGHLDTEIAEKAIRGILEGCNQGGCKLSGGKVVENAGLYPDGVLYEMSGCAVGSLNKNALIDGSKIVSGDVLVGLPSTGLHSNGYSLARRILSMSNLSLKDQLPGADVTIGEALIVPTKIYVKQVLDIISKVEVKGMAHITGGGLTDNLPRIFPAGLGAKIRMGSWHVPQIFNWLKDAGNVEEEEMLRTFNMGIGMVLVVEPRVADKILEEYAPSYLIGTVIQGKGVVYDRLSTASSDPCKGPGVTNEGVATLDADSQQELLQRLAGQPPRLFPIGDEFSVSRAERVDEKLQLALEMQVHNTIGIDLVAVNVNSIVTTGATPLSFVDYFSTSHLDVDVAEQVIEGVVQGCIQAECGLRGGETAEMQGFHAEGEYMLNAYASGRVKQSALIDGSTIAAGDILLGLLSSGIHSHGFSMVDSILKNANASLKGKLPGSEVTIGESLLMPTKIYVKQVLEMISCSGVKGISDVTEGGLTGSIQKILPSGLGATVRTSSWEVPRIFKWLQEAGSMEPEKAFGTFNMGVGMVLVLDPCAVKKILSTNKECVVMGEIVQGARVVYE
ncbi:trifunctional purine biosynthetic protein adenosine-3 [Selaginella moellendorffii]|uniref:trifunctional purine biosynthetic protein adenosine-3 n=1 Tax=Selaginella moellendorffii TaxID=88036 RepID=UPI000D1C2579|nr:trifunctional purine biosynthetic protein adenosine-3 [Selaginella moellendorffii]|eukprot:XP_002982756.2 trifunctional purine biosynthetic protein adenosine-3 [Selaginella moellendorffii]